MNFIREKLSSTKSNRYKDKIYNLDLTYITEKIVAMALPGEGF